MAHKSVLAAFLALISTFRFAHAYCDEIVDLAGVPNFRAVWSYKTINGEYIRPHAIYRSGSLSAMTALDEHRLRAIGIESEIDLRGPIERRSGPSMWRSPPAAVFTPFSELRVTPNEPELDVYKDIALRHAGDIGRALKAMESGRQPILVHCAAGSDRTGVEIAILMTLLGVPQKDVYGEYLLSNKYWNTKGAPPLTVSTLDQTFHLINREYGSFDRYVSKGLRLKARDVKELKAAFLEASRPMPID